MPRLTALILSVAFLPLVAACGSGASGDAAPAVPTPPAVESETAQNLTLTPIAEGLEFPWGLAFLPNGHMLVTEREGRLRLIRGGELMADPITGTPEAYVDNQGGYLGVEVDPNFAENRYVYLAYSEGTEDSNGTVLVRGTLSENGKALEDVTRLFEAAPKKQRALHFGGRIQFLDDETMLLSLGDGFRWMDEAQSTDNHFGTIVRIKTDGSVPDGNPFADGDAPEVFSYGHRNVQGLAVDPANGTIYANEHGPKGGDEINVIEAGNNYGWPKITYGVNYDGSIITTQTAAEGMEQPIVKWVPSIAPSGLAFYSGDVYPGWTGDLFTSALAGRVLQRVDLENGKIVGEEALLKDLQLRYRHVKQGPDGHLYLLIDDIDGGVFRLDVEG